MELTVTLSWSGIDLHYHTQGDAVVRDLQDFIARQTAIPNSEQILLVGPPFKNTSHRTNISVLRGKKIFVYDRSSLSRSNSQFSVPPVTLTPTAVDLPTRDSLAPSHNSLREFALADDPLLRALADYERKFFHHVMIAEVYQTTGSSRHDACLKCIQEQRRVLEALWAAQDNLTANNSSLSSTFNSLWHQVCTSHEKNEKTVRNFETYLAQTAQVQIDPALQQADRKTLLDWLPAERLSQWCQECASYEHRIWKKANELRQLFQETSTAVATEIEKRAPPPPTQATTNAATEESPTAAVSAQPDAALVFESSVDTEANLREADQLCQRQRQIAETVGADYRAVLDKVLQAQQTHKSQNQENATDIRQEILQICSDFDDLRKAHSTTLLVEARTNDDKLWSIMQRCAATKTLAIRYLFRRLRSVAALQTRIREQGKYMSVVREGLTQQRGAMSDLEHVKHMPKAYHAAIEEVVYRRTYKQLFVQAVDDMMDSIAVMRDKEADRRQEFLNKHGRHLPRDFLPVLAELPSLCEVRIPRFAFLPNVAPPQGLSNSSATATSSNLSSYSNGLAVAVHNSDQSMLSTSSSGNSGSRSSLSGSSSQEQQQALSYTASVAASPASSGGGELLLQADLPVTSPTSRGKGAEADNTTKSLSTETAELRARCQKAEAEAQRLREELQALKSGKSLVPRDPSASTTSSVSLGAFAEGNVVLFMPLHFFRRTRCQAMVAVHTTAEPMPQCFLAEDCVDSAARTLHEATAKHAVPSGPAPPAPSTVWRNNLPALVIGRVTTVTNQESGACSAPYYVAPGETYLVASIEILECQPYQSEVPGALPGPGINNISIGTLSLGSIGLFVPAPFFRPSAGRTMIAVQNGTRRFRRCGGANAVRGPGSPGATVDTRTEGTLDTPKQFSENELERAQVFLGAWSMQVAMRLLRGISAAPPEDAAEHGQAELWPPNWPVQVVGRVTSVQACRGSPSGSPPHLPTGTPFLYAEVEVLDVQPFHPRVNATTVLGAGALSSPEVRAPGSAPGPDLVQAGSPAGSTRTAMKLPPLSGQQILRVSALTMGVNCSGSVHPVTPGTPGTSHSTDSFALSVSDEDEGDIYQDNVMSRALAHSTVAEEGEHDLVTEDEESKEAGDLSRTTLLESTRDDGGTPEPQ